jgi:hypothetical protein
MYLKLMTYEKSSKFTLNKNLKLKKSFDLYYLVFFNVWRFFSRSKNKGVSIFSKIEALEKLVEKNEAEMKVIVV